MTAEDRPRERTRRASVLRSLLGFPLLAKILVANAAIVVLGATAGSWLVAEAVRRDPSRSTLELVGTLALAGILLSVAVNAVILRLALVPLRDLERAAARVRAGDTDARAPISPLADRELTRVIGTFNAMLDRLAAYRARLRELARRGLQAAEEERKRIARELHDETAQRLAALRVRLRVLEEEGDPAARGTLLAEVREELTETMEGVRRFARGLRPPALDELGLVAAVETLAREMERDTALEVEVRMGGPDADLAPAIELAAYRIVQEALTNAARHADARRARVTLERRDGTAVITIVDDGHGFRLEEVMASDRGGLGLEGMRERAAYVGGRVDIESAPGAGTTVRVRLPEDVGHG